MMLELAGWIAPAATMIAAIMTAANLGARVTGWGFVVFTLGAAAWVMVAVVTGQKNLLFSNAFLFVVDLVGIWRWLGRRARYDTGAGKAAERSAGMAARALFPLTSLEGRPVLDGSGQTIATTVEAMAACDSGAIRYVVVREGGVVGVGERLHALSWDEVSIGETALTASVDGPTLRHRPVLDPQHWPTSVEAAGVG